MRALRRRQLRGARPTSSSTSPRCRPTWPAARCIRSRASRCRSASCGPSRAATCAIRSTDPFAAARDAAELPVDRARPPHGGRRHEGGARDRRRAGDAPVREARGQAGARRATTTPRCSSSRATTARPSSTRAAPAGWATTPLAVVDARLRVHGIERPARGRLLGDADAGVGQHQRTGDDDGREGGRHDPRRMRVRVEMGRSARAGAGDGPRVQRSRYPTLRGDSDEQDEQPDAQALAPAPRRSARRQRWSHRRSQAQQVTRMKIQTAVPSSSIYFDLMKRFGDRFDKMSKGAEVGDAARRRRRRRVRDLRRGRQGRGRRRLRLDPLLVGQEHRRGPVLEPRRRRRHRHGPAVARRLAVPGRRQRAVPEVLRRRAQAQHRAVHGPADGPRPARLVQALRSTRSRT